MSLPFEEAWEQVGRDAVHLLRVGAPASWTPSLLDMTLAARRATLSLLADVGREPMSWFPSARPTVGMLESDPVRAFAMLRDQSLPVVLPRRPTSELLGAQPGPDAAPWHRLLSDAVVASHAFAGVGRDQMSSPRMRWPLREDVAALTVAVLDLDLVLVEGLRAMSRPEAAAQLLAGQTCGLRSAARAVRDCAATTLGEHPASLSRLAPSGREPLDVPDASWVKPAWQQLLRLVADTPLTPRELRNVTQLVRRPVASTLTPERWRDWSARWSHFEHRLQRPASLMPGDGRASEQARRLVAFAARRIPGTPAGDLLELRYTAGVMARGSGALVHAVSSAVDGALAAGRWVMPDGDVSIGEPVWVPVSRDEDLTAALSAVDEVAPGVVDAGANMLRHRVWRPAVPERPAAVLGQVEPDQLSARARTTMVRARAFADRAPAAQPSASPAFPSVRGPAIGPLTRS